MSLRVVLDTNVLLVSISTRSATHWVLRGAVDERFGLCISTDIALEYEEVLARHMGVTVATDILAFLENAPNVTWVTPAYRWRLVPADPDDDKFADCAIAAGAAIVTEDGHFDALREVDFPPVDVLNIDAFRRRLAASEAPTP